MEFSQLLQNPILIWFLVGLALLILEFAAPGVYILFFGIGAWITALACAIASPDLDMQLLIFLISSVGLLIFLRKHIKKRFFDKPIEHDGSLNDEFIGKTAITLSQIHPNTKGQINFKGTTWSAVSDVEIEEGTPVEITGKESITLTIKPK